MKIRFLLSVLMSLSILCPQPCAAQEVDGVDSQPVFRGGDIDTFNDWVFRKVVYLLDNNIDFAEEGTITVSFTVNKKGKIKDVTIVSAYDERLANKVVSAIKKAPDWLPAIINGSPAEAGMIADIELYKHKVYLPSKPINMLLSVSDMTNRKDSPKGQRPVFSEKCIDDMKADEDRLRSWLASQIKSEKLNGIYDGMMVELLFIINKSGYVENVTVIKTTNPRFSRALVDAMYSCPKWYSPAIHDGEPINVRYSLSFRIVLSPPLS